MAGRRRRRATEATTAQLVEALPGNRTFDEVRCLVADALTEELCDASLSEWQPRPWVRDLSDEWVAYTYRDETFKVDYSIDDAGVITFGTPAEVEVRTTYDAMPVSELAAAMAEASGRTVESTDRIAGRLIEAKGTDDKGGRIFAVQIIESGDSKNGRRYTESVLQAASPLYEGAKAYDHHRTDGELQTSTIAGLIGHYRNVAVNTSGLQGDLHLLPSATHTAEALDASLANQAEGLPPLVGISHDVLARYRPVTVGGRRLQEATAIDKVNSADVVADPAAGGRATRMLAGGLGDTTTQSSTTQPEEKPVTIEELQALLKGATPEQRATVLEGLGMSAEDLAKLRLTEAEPIVPAPPHEPTAAERTTEAVTYTKDSAVGRSVVRTVLSDANIDARLAEGVIEDLPETFTEADVTERIGTMQRVVERLERSQLTPTVGHLQVTQDEVDKKRLAMDAFFAENFREGYSSFKGMALDWLGINPYRLDAIGEDVNRIILRECVGPVPWDSSRRRSTESVISTTFSLALGDSITRRLLDVYNQPALQSWQSIVSSKVPLTDFRTQRIDRVGGYGTLPAVAEGAPYQPLTSPGNEEITYALSKRGGTEDWTLETIANDDVRLISRTPYLLGLAAAQTLYRFVWDFLDTNATCSYDSVALFAAGHGSNTATNALSGANVSAGRKVMRKQTAYGDTKNVLQITPKTLVVVSDLEELAFEICTSRVAMPSGAPVGAASDVPNLHQGMTPLVIDYWSSTTKWALVADPAMIPTVEVGFYQGREDPELFQQNDPQTGSVFTNDKVTWKIRHIYSGALLEHRGFYRGNT